MALAVGLRLNLAAAIDDAYITFRYARNLAEGAGFVYNSGEHVLGTTTPLWTLVLAAGYRAGATDLPRLALVLGSAADAATVLLLYWIMRRLGLGWWAALASGAYVLCSTAIAAPASGMETSLFTALLLGAVAANGARRPGLCGFVARLATLTRPEGVLVAGLVLGRHMFARRWPPLPEVIGFALPILPWISFAWLWFGSALPNSVVAKAAAFDDPPVVGLMSIALLPVPAGVSVVPAAVLLRRQVAARLRAEPGWWPLAAFAPALLAAYAAASLRGTAIFDWYVVPLVPFYLLALVAAIRGLTRDGHQWWALVATVGMTVVLALGFNWTTGRFALVPRSSAIVREPAYAAAARLLEPRLSARSVVALPEIGIFGYLSQATGATVLDTIGLVSPMATAFYPLPSGFRVPQSVPPELKRQQEPDFLVSLDVFLGRPLLDAAWFQRDYHLLASFEAHIWGGEAVEVYERRIARTR